MTDKILWPPSAREKQIDDRIAQLEKFITDNITPYHTLFEIITEIYGAAAVEFFKVIILGSKGPRNQK